MGTIAVKNVDESLYKKVKALASLRGRTVGEEVNGALQLWLSQRARVDLLEKWDRLEKEAEANNREFEKKRSRLLAEHAGEFAVVTSGAVVGTYKKKEEAY